MFAAINKVMPDMLERYHQLCQEAKLRADR